MAQAVQLKNESSMETPGASSEPGFTKEPIIEIDPVYGMNVEATIAAASFVHKRKTYYVSNRSYRKP